MEDILIQWIVNGGLIAIWRGDRYLGKTNDFIWRHCVGGPIPERMTEVVCSLNPGIPIDCIGGGNLFCVRLYDLLMSTISVPELHHFEATYFIQEHVWPVPGWEQNGPMSTISTPSGPGVPRTTTNGAVPNPVWQAVNLANGKEGRNVRLIFILHNLYTNSSDISIENQCGKTHEEPEERGRETCHSSQSR